MNLWRRSPEPAKPFRDWSLHLEIHARWLRTAIIARSGDVSAADEIYQEVALAAIRQNPEVSDAKVAPWLYRVAVRQALLYRRRLGRQRRLRERLSSDQPLEGYGTAEPIAWLLADEQKQLIQNAIRQLHAKDAELLMLKYTENWTYRDLSEHLGISESAVETRLHRARQKLRMILMSLQVVESAS